MQVLGSSSQFLKESKKDCNNLNNLEIVKNSPLISVVMSVCNDEKYLSEAIESILNQTYTNFEFIIINDGSTDSSFDIIQEYMQKDERIVLISRENKGLPYSLNEGIEKAKGKYIARMDSDDISKSERIQMQLEFLEEFNYDLVGSYIEKIDMNHKSLGVSISPITKKQIDKLLPHATVAFHPTWFGKKDLFVKTMYNELFITAQDYEFLSRAIAKGYRVGNIDKVLLNYRVNFNALSNKKAYIQFKLHQFVTIKQKNKLFDLNKEVEKFLSNIDETEQEKYIRANNDFVKLAKERTIFNTFKVIKNVLFNKDFRYRFKNFIMNKLILKYV